jgi:hypothetical protein
MLQVTRGNIRSAIAVFGILVWTVLLSPQNAWGYFTTASLGGTVLDSSGAGVPDAAVTRVAAATSILS